MPAETSNKDNSGKPEEGGKPTKPIEPAKPTEADEPSGSAEDVEPVAFEDLITADDVYRAKVRP
ncbi:hypothetical protein FPRO03_03214 [Fusarium proliferatum]|nr:hypothetical protein FPRO03_03214 [Fusarium proliferatum]